MSLVSVSHQDGVCTVRLERPEARNALSTALLGELLDGLGQAVSDETVRVILLTGAGATFSAGADVREDLDMPATARRMELFGQLFEAVVTAPTPTIAVVSGHCVGGGAELAAACDIRVADATATFRFPGAAMGYPVGAAKLVGLIGLGAAKDLVLTGRTISGEEAARLGFVQHLVADGATLAAAGDLAGQIAANDRETVRYLKRLFDRFSGVSDRVAVEADALLALARAGGDYEVITPPEGGVGSWAGGHRTGR